MLLVGVGISEIPEHIRLIDDVSNDFVISAWGRESLQPGSIGDEGAPTLGNASLEVVSARTSQDFRFPFAAVPFHLSGQDRLVLCSVQRT